MGYDFNGNLATYNGYLAGSNGWSYSCDAQNRLKVVQHGNTIVEQFWYDGLNRIITKNLNGNVTYNVYDNWNLIEEYAGPYSPTTPPPTPTPTPTALPQLPTPVFSPNGGQFPTSQSITVSIIGTYENEGSREGSELIIDITGSGCPRWSACPDPSG